MIIRFNGILAAAFALAAFVGAPSFASADAIDPTAVVGSFDILSTGQGVRLGPVSAADEFTPQQADALSSAYANTNPGGLQYGTRFFSKSPGSVDFETAWGGQPLQGYYIVIPATDGRARVLAFDSVGAPTGVPRLFSVSRYELDQVPSTVLKDEPAVVVLYPRSQ
ncbi:MAG: hypothetical protein WAN50_00825 [Minisyncoccia bacterium]